MIQKRLTLGILPKLSQKLATQDFDEITDEVKMLSRVNFQTDVT